MSQDFKKLIGELEYVVLPGRLPPRAYVKQYDAAFQLWNDIWSATFKELDGAEALFSDDFTRQDEVGAIFRGQECWALSFFRYVDLSRPADVTDTYFKVWPEAALKVLREEGNLAFVGSNITLAPAARDRTLPVATKDLLMSLLIKNFLASEARVMTGTMRNDKGMGSCAYRHKATPILQNHVHHGVSVDLVRFQRKGVGPTGIASVDEASEILWKRHVRATQGSQFSLAA
jgi:hypothetical protein